MLRSRGVALFVLTVVAGASAAPIPIASRIAEVHLFKNGLAALRRTVELPSPGTYRIETIEGPVHGTFWVSSPVDVRVRTATEEIEVPLADQQSPGFGGLTGKQVTLYFREASLSPVTGVVVASPNNSSNAQPYLVLKTGNDLSYVDTSQIAYANVRGGPETVTASKPAMYLDAREGNGYPAQVEIHYMTLGMSWAPSYRVDVSHPGELTIRQQAVIRNDLELLTEAEVYLISGFPGIEFFGVTSPIAPGQSWNSFLSQLQQLRGDAGGHALTQQAILSNAVLPNALPEMGVSAAGEGPDMHFQPAGPITLGRGEALSMETAQATAAYRRLVEWTMTDTRAVDGRLFSASYGPGGGNVEDEAWDVLEFSNPFEFPMTTGPALVVAEGRVLGQHMTHWTSRGETTRVKITKALSIRTSSEEREIEDAREAVTLGGTRYQRAHVEGTLRVQNHRAETIDLIIRREFSGDLLEANGEPASRLLEEGVWSVNRRNELTWTRTIAPGGEDELRYRYSVLVLQ